MAARLPAWLCLLSGQSACGAARAFGLGKLSSELEAHADLWPLKRHDELVARKDRVVALGSAVCTAPLAFEF